MDESVKVEELKRVLGPDVQDDYSVLLSFLDQAKDVILSRMYPYMTDADYDRLKVPNRHAYRQIRIAAWMLNKRGAEGETQHIENGIHRSYKNSDVPEELLRDILPSVGIPR